MIRYLKGRSSLLSRLSCSKRSMSFLAVYAMTLGVLSANASTITININKVVNSIDSTKKCGVNLEPKHDVYNAALHARLVDFKPDYFTRQSQCGVFSDTSPTKFVFSENGNVQPGFGVDKFVTSTLEAGATPINVINEYSLFEPGVFTYDQLIKRAVDYVTYCNVTKKWGVKYWEIGNEPWIHKCSTEENYKIYGNFVKDVSIAMKAVDPTIKVGLCANTAMCPTVIPICMNYVDWIATHAYSKGLNWAEYDAKTIQIATGLGVKGEALKAGLLVPLVVTEFNTGNDKTYRQAWVWRGLNTFTTAINHLYGGADAVLFWTLLRSGETEFSGATDFFSLSTSSTTYGVSPVIGNSIKILNDTWPADANQVLGQSISGNDKVLAWALYNSHTKALTVYLLNRNGTNSDNATVTLQNYTGLTSNTVTKLTGNGPEELTMTRADGTPVTVSNGTFTITLPKLSITAVIFPGRPTGTIGLPATATFE